MNIKNKIDLNKLNKGITLIALVVTIIILLLLAGASIAMLTGENGLITKVRYAEFATRIGEYKESIDLYVAKQIIKDQSFNPDELIAVNNGAVTISDVIPQIGNDKKNYQIVNGELLYIGNNKKEIANCLKLGVEVSNVVLDENNTILRN